MIVDLNRLICEKCGSEVLVERHHFAIVVRDGIEHVGATLCKNCNDTRIRNYGTKTMQLLGDDKIKKPQAERGAISCYTW